MDEREEPLRIIYAGTPDFAVPPLMAIAESAHELVGVVTNPDRPSGRGKKPRPPAVKVAAQKVDAPVFQPESVKTDEALAQLEAWEPDVMVVAAYGQILPERILDVPTYGCINIHASLLPKYRGAAPINWAIVEGEERTGVTIMQMDAGLDTGPMLLKESVEIGALETAQELHDRLAELGAELIVDALDQLAEGALEPTPQDDELSSYAPMLSKSDGEVDWSESARRVADHIRGFNPWPGAFSHLKTDGERERIKLHLASPATGSGEPGEVIEADRKAGHLVVACGEGAIECLKLQAPGRRAMEAGDFLNGCEIQEGHRFE